MPAWRIASWDQSTARGAIVSDGVGRLEFDGAVAFVDDFVVGEAVHVELERKGDSFEVVKLWPDDPRVSDPTSSTPTPELDPEVSARIGQVLAALSIDLCYRVWRMDGDLVVRGDDTFEYGWRTELIFAGVEYIDLPSQWDGKSIRLANMSERAYLATRCDIRRDLIALKIVDEDLRAYFVVCSDFRVGPGRRAP